MCNIGTLDTVEKDPARRDTGDSAGIGLVKQTVIEDTTVSKCTRKLCIYLKSTEMFILGNQ